MDLEWDLIPGDTWWLHETNKPMLTNHYDVVKRHGNRWVIRRIDLREYMPVTETVVGEPFATLQEAKDVAEMMHRMGVWEEDQYVDCTRYTLSKRS